VAQNVQITDDGAVSPPYCVPCPLARTAVLVEGGGLAPAIQLKEARIAKT